MSIRSFRAIVVNVDPTAETTASKAINVMKFHRHFISYVQYVFFPHQIPGSDPILISNRFSKKRYLQDLSDTISTQESRIRKMPWFCCSIGRTSGDMQSSIKWWNQKTDSMMVIIISQGAMSSTPVVYICLQNPFLSVR